MIILGPTRATIDMASRPRLPLFVAIGLFIPIYLVFLVNQGILIQIAGAVVLLLLVALLIFTGSKDHPNSMESPDSKLIDSIDDVELPPPILSAEESQEGGSRNITRSRGRSTNLPEMPMPEPVQQTPIVDDDEPELIEATSGVAERYVAGSDPESIVEMEIENFLSAKRQQKIEITERIRRNKRIELSKRAAAEAAKWTELEDGEDIGSLLKESDHGQKILIEPENPSSSAPQGISYVRIDESRVMKVRVPLDVPRGESSEKVEDSVLQELSLPPPMQDFPQPPGQGPSGIPPPVDSND